MAWFGYDGAAACLYRNDEELHCDKAATVHKKPSRQSVRIASLDGDKATYLIDGNTYTVRLRLFGAHNALNCAAALSVVRQIEGDEFNSAMAVEHLGAVAPAYGRGEVINGWRCGSAVDSGEESQWFSNQSRLVGKCVNNDSYQ